MKHEFPKDFLWGTATSALQIETAFDHDWKFLVAKDGSVLNKTIEHQKHREEDAGLIASLGNAYRMSCDWSRLQAKPFAELESGVIDEYRSFIGSLKDKGQHIMMVLHHFANPVWLAQAGGWENQESCQVFGDYAKKMVAHFGDLVDSWNTINEPLGYAMSAYLLGQFPPHKKNPLAAKKVLEHLSKAHSRAYVDIKNQRPDSMVGVSNNTMIFSGESILGKPIAALITRAMMEYSPSKFLPADFIGMSYYGRVPFKPYPVSEIDRPGELEKMGRQHDMMWENYPGGLEQVLLHFHEQYHKPIIITENGTATLDDSKRAAFIIDHLAATHRAIEKGVDVKGYFHWSAFDNFELNLGTSYRFGLIEVDFNTMERTPKPSAKLYADITRNNGFESQSV